MRKMNAKPAVPELDQDAASRILSNVFAQVQTEPNTVSLGVLESYSNYRIERFALQKGIIGAVMLLFILLPLLFLAPSVEISSNANGGFTQTPSYQVAVKALLPVRRITAQMAGRSIPVYEVEAHRYEIQPTTNGEMEIEVTLVNRQSITHSVTVGNVDQVAPHLTSSNYDGITLDLFVTDDASGVDYENAYATDLGGNKIPLLFSDASSGRLQFPYPEETMNIFIPDKAGNELQLVVSVKKESSTKG